jgi:signal transduction histidine kinase
VLLNLLSNAIKFSPDGGAIVITAGVSGNGVRIEVADRGSGIAVEQQRAIFEPFVQADSGLRRSFDGLGLGLAICRSIVGDHGGTIEVISARGEGARFIVSLPRTRPHPATPAAPPEA